MFKPIKTTHTNLIFKAPKYWNSTEFGDCIDSYVCALPPYEFSWWKLSLLDRFKILFGRNIRVAILGANHPPMNISIDPDNVKEME